MIEARYERIVRAACAAFARRGYHFLVLDRSLDQVIGALDRALAAAGTPEARLLALARTHLDFALYHGQALKVINRDDELLPEPRRSEVAAKREAYVERGLAILRELDPHRRSDAELRSATLFLGMLNGVATRPVLRSREDGRALAEEVGRLFLYGFLETGVGRTGLGPAAARRGPTRTPAVLRGSAPASRLQRQSARAGWPRGSGALCRARRLRTRSRPG
ncbi:MAG TPA: hypothetical protein VNM66_06855, partial [Thermodesulfobacteriota bacterium]|nr:hypothetical protein [Thermodesulfobacteriota bacterium]